jgi:hypothetical protein
MPKICPNYDGCRLVKTDVVEPDSNKKKNYLAEYCVKDENWRNCVRYITRKSLWICPDFVLPDSNMTEDEIIERYEKKGKEEKKE